ncbi:MAG: hypothetical protein PQJ44_01655 [Sphaerochaetaceae bacterium]|nr:hypothetical protein [Sphaerochaetaceae bacterium]
MADIRTSVPFLSLDEAAQIHEIFDETFNIKWIYIYAPLGGIFFLASTYFLTKITYLKKAFWIIGGLMIFALGGLVGEAYAYFINNSAYSLIETVFEEGLELLGSTFVLNGCMMEIDRLFKNNYSK